MRSRKRKLVVIVDEGHLLSKEMLEEIRFLLNYKMDSENPLTLILAGQTELWDKLKLQAYRAIRHRIDIQCFLTPYDFAQTKAYIEKQLEYAGHPFPIFSEDALLRIFGPIDVRVQRVARRQNLTPEKARQLIVRTDKRRASYYEYYSSRKWGAVDSYDFCLDSSYLGLGGTVELIRAMVDHKEHPIPSPTEIDPTQARESE